MVSTLANLFARSGCDVTVIYSQRDETPELLANHFDNSVSLVRLDMRPFYKTLLITKQLRDTLQEIEPDIIHLHSSIGGFIGRLATIGLSNVEVYYSPHCISFMMAKLKPHRKMAYILLEKFANLLGGEYIACSESERSAITRYLSHAVVHKIDNAIDLDVDLPTAKPMSRDTIKIINVGEIRPQKGPELFAQIAREVRREFPQVEFVWVGDGTPARRQVLLDADVTVAGWMDKSAVMEQLSEADLYLSSSFWEGLPVSLIEAMAIGLPIIGQACSGNTDLIEENINGRLFNSAEQAVSIIRDCLKNPESTMIFSQNAIKLAEEKYSLSTFHAKFSTLYQVSCSSSAMGSPQAQIIPSRS